MDATASRSPNRRYSKLHFILESAINNLIQSSNIEALRHDIFRMLSEFGHVESIQIYEEGHGNSEGFILVTMLDMKHASMAASALGLNTFGFNSLIVPIPALRR